MNQQKLNAAVVAIIQAWTDEGPSPRYHREQKARLAREWPTLHRALLQLVAAPKAAPSDADLQAIQDDLARWVTRRPGAGSPDQ